MNIIKYPSESAVHEAMAENENILVCISFDAGTAVMSPDDNVISFESLLSKAGMKDTNIDKYFRIILLGRDNAEWVFECPPDYKDITSREKRIESFYKDGFSVISDFLCNIGYLIGITIPRVYCQTDETKKREYRFLRPKGNIIWEVYSDEYGPFYFSFDKIHIYNLFTDYYRLSDEQREIFKKEYPVMARLKDIDSEDLYIYDDDNDDTEEDIEDDTEEPEIEYEYSN